MPAYEIDLVTETNEIPRHIFMRLMAVIRALEFLVAVACGPKCLWL